MGGSQLVGVTWAGRALRTSSVIYRDLPIKSASELTAAPRLFSPKQYERLGKTGAKLLRREPSAAMIAGAKKREERKRQADERKQLQIDKDSSVLTKGALRRKMTSITLWAKKEHPEIWERIVAKISLRESLQGHPWEPAVLLVRSPLDHH